mmetsp:Transcript_3374/g.8249  ORF Transcript_3374/g.8249 Transcript_3374/m.8249 type:complete len:105 (-) Transcript_3374:37-351(-)
MRPLPAIFPAARVALFQEELLVRINAVVHETRELVFYVLELVVGHRLGHCCEATAACRVRQPGVRHPRGGAQEGHACMLVWRALALFSAAGAAARERMDAKAPV